MDLLEKYVLSITFKDIQNGCTYKVHTSYVLISIIFTWFIHSISTILTLLLFSTVFIIITTMLKEILVSEENDNREINNLIKKLNNTDSESEDSLSDSQDHLNNNNSNISNLKKKILLTNQINICNKGIK